MSIDDVLSGKAQFAVVCGDATAVMATLPDGCAHVSYFDPPYGLSAQSTENIVECLTTWLAGGIYTHKAAGFMGSSWDAFTPGPEVFREVHRALRPGGYCVAFSSTRTVDLLGIAVRLAGFEIRPGLAWAFGSGFPKSLNVSIACDRDAGEVRDVVGVRESFRPNTQPMRDPSGFQDRSSGNVTAPSSPAAVQWDGYGTDTKPSVEPLVVARKPLDLSAYCVTIGSCLRRLYAKLVGLSSTSKQPESSEVCDSALTSAGRLPSPEGSSATMGMCSSGYEQALASSLNTVSSWLNTLGELSSLASTFTTETESGLTIDLKTLNSSLSKITAESMLGHATRNTGASTSAERAGWMFDAVKMKLRFILASSADASATSAAPTYSPERAASERSHGIEPLIVARKALDRTVAHNVQAHGCGALNIDAARICSGPSSGGDVSGETALGQGSGWNEHTNRPTVIDRSMSRGRFPAALALVHDEGCVCEGTRRVRGDARTGGGERPGGFGNVGAGRGNGAPCAPGHADPDGMESIDAWTCTATCAVAELGRQSGESESTDNARHCSAKPVSASKGAEYNRVGYGHADAGTAARFFYQAKASSSDRLAYITCTAGCAHHDSVAFQKDARDSARDPSREQPHGFCRACNGIRTHYQHATVKPLDLAKYHARLLSLPPHTRPIALVPFCGTGIEARALLDVGFRVIAIDLDPRHCAMTEFRLTHKEPEHVTEERAAVTEAERGDWTKPIRVSEVVVKAPVPSARKEQLPLFGSK